MGILIKKIIFIILITFSIQATEVDEIVFSIENDIYTTIDLDKRIKYLNIINKQFKTVSKARGSFVKFF